MKSAAEVVIHDIQQMFRLLPYLSSQWSEVLLVLRERFFVGEIRGTLRQWDILGIQRLVLETCVEVTIDRIK